MIMAATAMSNLFFIHITPFFKQTITHTHQMSLSRFVSTGTGRVSLDPIPWHGRRRYSSAWAYLHGVLDILSFFGRL
jgi:hypothetical protein